MRTCENCGKEYEVKKKATKSQRFCSTYCRVDFHQKKKSQDIKESRGFTCEQCGKQYHPVRSTSKYCSVACKQAAYRERKQSTPEEIPKKYKMTVVTLPEGQWFDSDGSVNRFGVGCSIMHQNLKNLGFDPADYDCEIKEVDYSTVPELMAQNLSDSLPFILFTMNGSEKKFPVFAGALEPDEIKFLIKQYQERLF